MAKRLWERLSTGITSNSDGLDFSKWFSYNNQDLDNVHSYAEEINNINRMRMEQYLWVDISKEEPSDEAIMNYAKSLTWERSKIAANLANQWYDFNESVAYLDNYEKLWFSNPLGKWLEIFKKDDADYKWKSFLNAAKWVWRTALWLETAWFIGNEIWDAWFRRMTRPTDMDVQKSVTDDRTKGKYNSAKEQYDKVTDISFCISCYIWFA